jgi:PAS domain S-box-containing protein
VTADLERLELPLKGPMRDVLHGGGHTAAQMRSHDWSASPLGAPETWPQSLRSVVGLLLNSKFPMFVAWGPELGLLYNDAYAEILGAKHPAALGARFHDVWSEIWEDIGPIIDAALKGQPTFHENLPLLVHRRGFDERTWFTFSYSPVYDEAGAIAGMFCACTETTATVLAERSSGFRLTLEERLRGLSDPDGVTEAAAEVLGMHLGVARVGYADVESGTDGVEWATVRREWNQANLPSIVGRHRLLDYGIARVAALRAGKNEITADFTTELDLRPGEAAVHLGLGIRAQVVVPLVKVGRLAALLFVHSDTARRWAPDEVAAAVDAAERTWAAVERGRAETKLREGEERLRLALEAAGAVGTWDWDVLRGRIHVDATFAALYGIRPERASEAPPVTDFVEGMHPDDRSRVAAEIEAALARGGEYTTEYRVIGLDSVARWVLVHGHCRHDAGGSPTRFSGVVLDISDRKKIETEARETAARLRTVFDTVPVGIIVAEAPTGRINGSNAAAEHIFGHPLLATADVESYGEWVAFHPDGRRVEASEYPLARVFREGVARAEMEALYRRGDGRDTWLRFIAAPIRDTEDGSMSGGLVVSLDIDREKRAEAELRLLNANLEARIEERTAQLRERDEQLRQSQKMEAIGQLTGGLAHDVNNMLQGIGGALQLMEKRIEGGRLSDLPRLFKAAQDGVGRAAALTHRLLAFARRGRLDPVPVDVNDLVAGMLDLVRRTVGPGNTVRTHFHAGKWLVRCDASGLESALLNLAINARDAIPDGGTITLSTDHVRLSAGDLAGDGGGIPPGDFVLLSVTDTGAGMPPDVVARAFEPFFTTKPMGKGTGLGLSQTYGFVRQSGGFARIRSVPGEGTKVSLYLPRYEGDVAVAPAVSTAPSDGAGGMTILLVEDEPAVRSLAAEILRDRGYVVLEAADGPSGLAALTGEARVDLLVTDVGLPGLNGRQLADAAREHRPTLPVLFITGYAGVALDGGLPAGMAAITKPFSLDDFVERVGAMFAVEG